MHSNWVGYPKILKCQSLLGKFCPRNIILIFFVSTVVLTLFVVFTMNAAQQQVNPSPSSRLKKRRHKRHRQKAYQMVVLEITVKLLVNMVLSLTAIAALTRLLPYQQLQLAKLNLLEVEKQEVEQRVELLREQFSRNFDPHQSKQVMQEQSSRVDPNQRRIFWLDN